MPSLIFWGRTLNVDDFECSTRSTFICRAKGKGGSFFEKVLASTDNGWTWEMTESNKVLTGVEYALWSVRFWTWWNMFL